jgi:diguanylate cyclase (GGDEF)-like protein
MAADSAVLEAAFMEPGELRASYADDTFPQALLDDAGLNDPLSTDITSLESSSPPPPATPPVSTAVLRELLAGSVFRMLRFPARLEQAFRQHFRDSAAELLDRSVYGLIALYLSVVVPVALLTQSADQATWMRFAVYPIGAVLVVVWASTRLAVMRAHVETTLGLGVFACLCGTLYCAMLMRDSYFGLVAAYETIYVLIVAFALLRLSTRLALCGSLAAFLLAAGFAGLTGVKPLWLSTLLYFFVPLAICAVNGYMLEYAARRDFVQMLCHRQESGQLLQDMAAVGNDTGDVHSMLEFAIGRMCANMAWVGGHACLVNPLPGEREVVSHLAADDGSEWAEAFRQEAAPARHNPLVTKVMHLDQPTWKAQTVSIGGRKAEATQLAFPVYLGIDVVAVLVFFSPRRERPEERLLSLMAQAGQQLGRAIDRRRLQQELSTRALYDGLTNLPNRAYLFDTMRSSLARARRREDYHFAVLFMDIDRFKWVNDSLGHVSGDQLLTEFGRRVSDSVRPGDLVARLGGDEFAVLVDDVASKKDVLRVVDRIQQQLRRPMRIADHDISVGVSTGVVFSDTHYSAPEELLRDADTAMYLAKQQGRGRHVVFASQMREEAVDRLRMMADLRRAIEGDELSLHYQPIVSLESGCVSGFEALVRWQHPVHGMVGPDRFVPLAEETGLVFPLTQWVLRRACQQLGDWQRELPDSTPLGVSVNLCARYFAQPDMPDQIRELMTASGIRSGSLRLEITETQIIENAEICMHNIHRLGQDNVAVYIDDFGTGYSSLNYLASFRVNALKIDRSFMHRVEHGGKEAIVVRAITSLSRHLGLDVIAEGVETMEQLECLQTLGCQYVQGYLFSRPMAAEAATGFIGRQMMAPQAVPLALS